MQHRRAEIIDALYELFEPLRSDSADPYGSEYPVEVKTVQKRYRHWTTLDSQNAIPALLLLYGDGRLKRSGGRAGVEYAAVGEVEEHLPFVLQGILKETSESVKDITTQSADLIYSVEKLINGTKDLGIDGVVNVFVQGDRNSEGAISALQGTPFEVIKFRIVVVHVYYETESV